MALEGLERVLREQESQLVRLSRTGSAYHSTWIRCAVTLPVTSIWKLPEGS